MTDVPADVAAFGSVIADHLTGELGAELVGAWFVGSIALGGYVPGQSDIDVVAVTARQVPDERKPAVADGVVECTSSCPARGLELSLYRRDVASAPAHGADFELNANGGLGMPRSVHLDAAAEPAFWYVLDRAVAHRRRAPRPRRARARRRDRHRLSVRPIGRRPRLSADGAGRRAAARRSAAAAPAGRTRRRGGRR